MIDVAALAPIATGRSTELFTPDVTRCAPVIRERVAGRRILAIGAAGSIGASTIRALLPFAPCAIHVVDQNENGLAELVRDLRSGPAPLDVEDFQALPIDYGAPVMHRLLTDATPYDIILNFAALKHVRSEKDVYSLTQLLDTNLVKQRRFMEWLAEVDFAGRYFCVSTDKAANPVNMMGASKRLMEHVIFARPHVPGLRATVTSARFANVAFSAGSLLESFVTRLAKRQPLAAPRNTRRYFVSLAESGQICLLAAVMAPADYIVVPRLAESIDLRTLDSIAAGVIDHAGLRPRIYDDEHEARGAVERDLAGGHYPLVLTPLDTSGEKPYEEFVAADEHAIDLGFEQLEGVGYTPVPADLLEELLQRIEALVDGTRPMAKSEVVDLVKAVLPGFAHIETGRNLDQRM